MVLTLAVGESAHAQISAADSEVVAIGPSSCVGPRSSLGEWVELLRVELAADDVRVELREEGTSTVRDSYVSVEWPGCSGVPSSATLTFSRGPIQRTRNLPLVGVDPAARPRVVAIAVADLARQGLAAARTSVSSEPASPEPPHEGAQTARRPPATRTDPSGWRSVSILASADAKAFASGHAWLFGPRVGSRIPIGSRFVVSTDVGVLWGSANDPLGRVDETVGTFGVGLLAAVVTPSITFGVGPRFEAGIGWFRGYAAEATTTASSARSPLVLLALAGLASFRIEQPWSGFVGLDIGTSLYGFGLRAETAGPRHVSDLLGPFVTARVGVAVALGGG